MFFVLRVECPERFIPSSSRKVEGQYNYHMTWVYMIRNKGNQLYVGVTKDPNSRVYYHNRKRGSQFTQNNPSFETVFLEKYPDLATARKREIQIKKWRRDKKDMLIKLYSEKKKTKLSNS